MAHNIHMTALTDELHQRIGGHTGTHLAAVIGLLAAASVEIKIEPVLDDGLVAAAAQRHFNTQGCKVVSFLKGLTVHTQTDGNRCGQAGGTGNFMDAFQQGELLRHSPFQITLFKHKQIAVSFQLAQKALEPLRPGSDFIAQFGIHAGNGTFRQILGEFLVIVDEDNGHHRT